VRHGESGWNSRNLIQGQSWSAPGLTQQGREQAEAVASRIKNTVARLVVSSDLRRAIETAIPIAAALRAPHEIDSRLRERCFGNAEGEMSDSVCVEETGLSGELVVDADARSRGGESIRQLYDRVSGFVDHLLTHPLNHPVVLVTHGGVIRVMQAYLGGIDPDQMRWLPVPNVAVMKITTSKKAVDAAINEQNDRRSIYEATSQESVGKFTSVRGTI